MVLTIFTIALVVAVVMPHAGFALICATRLPHLQPDASAAGGNVERSARDPPRITNR